LINLETKQKNVKAFVQCKDTSDGTQILSDFRDITETFEAAEELAGHSLNGSTTRQDLFWGACEKMKESEQPWTKVKGGG
jgi:hypothetical protein